MSGSLAARAESWTTIGATASARRGEQRQVEGGRRSRARRRRRRPARRAGWSPPARRWCREPATSTSRTDHSGSPHQPPRLAERAARAAALLERAPRHAEGDELVQQVRAAQPVRRAQVELDHRRLGLRLEPHRGVGGRAGRVRAAPAAHPREPHRSRRRRPAGARTSGSPPITASAASSTSSSPGRGRPRITDSVSAIRDRGDQVIG